MEKNKLTIVKIWVKLWLKPTVDVEVELVIGDDGELEAMTPDEAEKSGKEKVGTTIGTKPYYNDKE